MARFTSLLPMSVQPPAAATSLTPLITLPEIATASSREASQPRNQVGKLTTLPVSSIVVLNILSNIASMNLQVSGKRRRMRVGCGSGLAIALRSRLVARGKQDPIDPRAGSSSVDVGRCVPHMKTLENIQRVACMSARNATSGATSAVFLGAPSQTKSLRR